MPTLVQVAIGHIRNGNNLERERAIKQLLAIAATSPQQRADVIRGLLAALALPLGSAAEQIRYDRWWDITSMLAILRANEAIEPLAKSIAINPYGLGSIGLTFYPAATALVTIGEPAVPSVGRELKGGEVEQRRVAAQCLGEIGGQHALQLLESALSTERDPTTILYIKAGIKNARNKLAAERRI